MKHRKTNWLVPGALAAVEVRVCAACGGHETQPDGIGRGKVVMHHTMPACKCEKVEVTWLYPDPQRPDLTNIGWLRGEQLEFSKRGIVAEIRPRTRRKDDPPGLPELFALFA
jgi:hypothetical protein